MRLREPSTGRSGGRQLKRYEYCSSIVSYDMCFCVFLYFVFKFVLVLWAFVLSLFVFVPLPFEQIGRAHV